MSDDFVTITQDVKLARFRTIDEFILDKARFELPAFNDLKKWNNRVVSNMLYYQTNYFAVILFLLLLSTFVHSRDIVVGITAVGLMGGVLAASLSKNPQVVQVRVDHPYIVLCAICAAGYYLIYVLNSVIVLLFTIAVPLLLMFVHASIRLRNFNSKVNLKLESYGMRSTVMGKLLELLNVEIKNE